MTGMMAIDGIWWREMDPIGVPDWINQIRLLLHGVPMQFQGGPGRP
jgi:hypothetical protein